jgi:predicted membrane protein
MTPQGGAAMDQAQLLWGLLFGSIGLGFLIYAKQQRAVVPLVVGLALSIYPFFINNVVALVLIGLILTILPYFIRL